MAGSPTVEAEGVQIKVWVSAAFYDLLGVSVATVRKTGISPDLANHNAFDEALEKSRRPEFRDNTAK